ncbi:MAG: FAD-dependent oxidoreductase, partial [bacterium]
MSPLLNTSDVLAASFTPHDGHCTPEAVVLGYAGGAKKLGATVLTDVEVTGINLNAGEITSVTTSAGVVNTSAV